MYSFTLVDQQDVLPGDKKIIPRDDFSNLISSKELIEKAKEEAKMLIDEANQSCDEIREKAKKEGFEEGLTKFNEQILHMDEQIKVIRHEMQKAVLPLVLRATKRIIGDQIEISSELIVEIVLQAIKSVTQSHHVKLFVNKEDLKALDENRQKIKDQFENIETFHIEERPDVSRGGCVIQTEKGVLNATLESQFRALARAFEAHLRKR